MKLIIGLGNPEPRYDLTRHNVGFFALDRLADLAGVTFTPKSKFKADMAEFSIGNEKILLAKPTTYYNESGQAARAICDFYKIAPDDVLVIHDELSLPFGTIRTRTGGSDAGNNGIKSLNAHLGPATHRVRVGVYTAHRDRVPDADFVLSKFTNDEIVALTKLLSSITVAIDSFIAGNFDTTTTKHDLS